MTDTSIEPPISSRRSESAWHASPRRPQCPGTGPGVSLNPNIEMDLPSKDVVSYHEAAVWLLCLPYSAIVAVIKKMNGPSRRPCRPRIVFRPWIWLLLAIFCTWYPADVIGRASLFRSSECLSAPTVAPDLAATTVKTQQVKDPLPAPFHPAPPVCIVQLLPAHTSWALPEREPVLLPPFATCPAPSLPRPPPSA